VSELNNPLPPLQVDEPVIVIELPPEPSPAPINPHAENPPFTALDLLLMVLILIASLFVFTTISFGISTIFSSRSVRELAKEPSTLVIVPAMALAYLVVMGFMYMRLARVRHVQFWQAVSWRWPQGTSWLGFLMAGGATAITLGVLASKLLPMPKSLPVDRYFGDRLSAYLMVFFGIAVAPLAEELLFRGFLYPVLDRWLQTLFMLPQELRHGSLWILIIAGWGYVERRSPASSAALLAGLVAIPIIGIFLARSTNPKGKPAHALLLPGFSLLLWGLVTRSLPGRGFVDGTTGLVILAFFLMAIGLARPLAASPAARVGRTLAILITATGFAMVHSDQLGSAWAPLLVLFAVGCVLTITRAVTKAIAPGVLIHVGYNATLFGLLYIGTDHFRHLERMTQ
jgi:membrane protease YdiL (CAAX protease family)